MPFIANTPETHLQLHFDNTTSISIHFYLYGAKTTTTDATERLSKWWGKKGKIEPSGPQEKACDSGR